jgi:hypothetical protein
MINVVYALEANLQRQQQELITKIRAEELQLNILKEGYLKVQGALELIETLKNSVEESPETDTEGA